MRRSTWQRIGIIFYWLARPLLLIYLRGSTRTRIIIEHRNMILVVKGWLGNGRWLLPGGGVRQNESLINGVIRELSEETGVLIKNRDKIVSIGKLRQGGYFNFTCHYFYMHAEEQYQIVPQMWEITQTEWVAIDQLDEITASKELLEALDLWKNTASTATM